LWLRIQFPLLTEVLTQLKDKYCGNRGGSGASNHFSKQVGLNNLVGCVEYVKSVADCGFAFNYAAHSGWCDCVPKSASKTTIGACQPLAETGTRVYHFQVLKQHTNHYCANRGGTGGSNDFSTNVGLNNLDDCVLYVKGVPNCSSTFNYNPGNGWCDCVPWSAGACKPSGEPGASVYQFPLMTEISMQHYGFICSNRGGSAGSNHFSKNVGPKNLVGCVTYVKSQAGCGFAFNYNQADGWCDCVPWSPTVSGACQPAAEAGQIVYHISLYSEVSPKHTNKVCTNRGGSGASNQFSTNVGAGNLVGCVSYVKSVANCGLEFNYAFESGWCDCVPKSAGACSTADEVGTFVYQVITTTTTTAGSCTKPTRISKAMLDRLNTHAKAQAFSFKVMKPSPATSCR